MGMWACTVSAGDLDNFHICVFLNELCYSVYCIYIYTIVYIKVFTYPSSEKLDGTMYQPRPMAKPHAMMPPMAQPMSMQPAAYPAQAPMMAPAPVVPQMYQPTPMAMPPTMMPPMAQPMPMQPAAYPAQAPMMAPAPVVPQMQPPQQAKHQSATPSRSTSAMDPQSIDRRSPERLMLTLGSQFTSWEEFKQCLETYEKENLMLTSILDCKKVGKKDERKKCPVNLSLR